MTSCSLFLDVPRRVRQGGYTRVFVVAFAGLLALALVPSALDAQQPARRPDVIFVPTPMEVVDSMLAVTRVTKEDRLYDLGSGDGRIVITAAKRLGTRGIGIDIDPQRIEESRRNADTAGVKNLVEFRQADLFETDLRQATVITLYLLPTLNVKLRPKLFAELRPGTRVVSHAFNMGDWEPDRTLYAGGRTVYYWVMPAKLDGMWTLTAPGGGTTRTYELRLTQNYQRLEGTATAGGRTLAVDSARVIGDSVVFTLADTIGRASGEGQRMRFAGRLDAGALSGTMVGGSGRWRATKRGGRQ